MTTLHDLDDLTLQVRNPQVRSYVAESLRALRAGALRAAVLSLWVAVNSDIIEKVRELSLNGDARATAEVRQLDGWIQAKDVRRLQEFESTILRHASADYDFLSSTELEGLERLQQDRHRCAHPAFSQDGALYEPTPEQVRAHFVIAIEALLAHPPVQGRSALARLQAEVLGPAFPRDQDKVTAYLGLKYLDHGKDVLVNDIVTAHLQQALAAHPEIQRERALQVLLAARIRRFENYRLTMQRRWPGLVSRTADPELNHVVTVLAADPELWLLLPESERIRLVAFVQQVAVPEATPLLVAAARVPTLLPDARKRLLAMTGDAAHSFLLAHPLSQFVPVAVERLEKAQSFREGWQFIDVIQGMLDHLSENDLYRVIQAARTNGQIHGAGNISGRLRNLFLTTWERWPHLQADWVRMVDEHPGFTLLRDDLIGVGWLPPEAEGDH